MRTDDIVRKHATCHSWIKLLSLPERAERSFAGKAHAFNEGYERVKPLEFDFIGSLDSDISFDAGYFEYLMQRFAQDPLLGVAGTPFKEGTSQYDYRFSRKDHVSGACQFFRRECFESIGQYAPLRAGGIDLVAVVTARMKGWKTQTFTDKVCIHHRKMGSAKDLPAIFRGGFHDYTMGVHPMWQLFRSAYQISRKPRLVGGCMLLAGYTWAALRRAPKPVSQEFVRFRRNEQICWLKDRFKSILKRPVFTRLFRDGEMG